MPPTKGQYSAASKQANDIKSSITAINQSNREYMNAMVGALIRVDNDTDFKDKTKQVREAYDDQIEAYRTRVANLLDSPVARDEEVESHFAGVQQESAVFESFMTGSVQDYPKYFQARIACERIDRLVLDVSKDTAEVFTNEADQCLRALEQLKKTQFSIIKTFGESKRKNVLALRDLYKRVLSGKTPSVTSAELNTLKSAAASLDPITDFEKARITSVSTSKLDALIALLNKKAAE